MSAPRPPAVEDDPATASAPPHAGTPPARGRLRDAAPWLVVLTLAGVLSAVTTREAFVRYREFRTGWSWDLAYYNQWYWALLFGDGELSVRPISAYANEGPPVWKTNYLSPLRYALIPVYLASPGPRTLLVVHALLFWLVVPAAYTLVRSETRSDAIAVAGATLVPLTPLVWPLAFNDFRELQMALPFVLWAVQGVRSRSVLVAGLGIAGMLACRQEFAVVVASLAIVPAREPEDVGRSYRWAHALIVIGLAWLLLGFFGYLYVVFGPGTVVAYYQQFLGEKATLGETLVTSLEFVALGLGAWAVFLLAAPRVSLLMLPWLWSIAGGRLALRYLSQEEWHHVRYAAPFVALSLAAGLIGFGSVGNWCLARPRGGRWLVGVWVVAAAVSGIGLVAILGRMDRQPRPIAAEEAREIWTWIDRVGPEEGVLAAYEVTAPLSSRRELYSYVLDVNRPFGFPVLKPEIRWVFQRNDGIDAQLFIKQGFRPVYRGPFLSVLRR